MTIHDYITLAFIPLFAVADRWVGWGGTGRVLPMTLAIVLGGALGWLLLGPWFGGIGLAWAIWRSVGFFGNSLAPADDIDRICTVFRYALQVPLPVALSYLDRTPFVSHGSCILGACTGVGEVGTYVVSIHHPWWLMLATMAACALVGIVLRFVFGLMVRDARQAKVGLAGDFDAVIEVTTGAAFGAAVAGYAILPGLLHL